MFKGWARHLVDHDYAWDPSCLPAYMDWYAENGKPCVVPREPVLGGITQPIPGPSQSVSTMGPPPRQEVVPRMVERTLGRAAWGFLLYVTRGCKKAARRVLRGCRSDLSDVGHAYRLNDLYVKHGVDPAIEDEEDSSPHPDDMPIPPGPEHYGNYFADYVPEMPSYCPAPTQEEDDGGITQLASPPRQAAAPDQPGPSTGPTTKRLRRASRRGRGEPAVRFTPD